MNPSLSEPIEAVQRGTLTIEQARDLIERWPAYQPGEQAQKVQALEKLAEMEVEQLRAALRRRRTQ